MGQIVRRIRVAFLKFSISLIIQCKYEEDTHHLFVEQELCFFLNTSKTCSCRGTHWDFGSISELEDTSDSCRIVRGQSGADFYSVNTFVTTAFGPSRSAADTINEEDFLMQRISACESFINSKPNFVSIDFWQRGDLVKVALEENAIRAG